MDTLRSSPLELDKFRRDRVVLLSAGKVNSDLLMKLSTDVYHISLATQNNRTEFRPR